MASRKRNVASTILRNLCLPCQRSLADILVLEKSERGTWTTAVGLQVVPRRLVSLARCCSGGFRAATHLPPKSIFSWAALGLDGLLCELTCSNCRGIEIVTSNQAPGTFLAFHVTTYKFDTTDNTLEHRQSQGFRLKPKVQVSGINVSHTRCKFLLLADASRLGFQDT